MIVKSDQDYGVESLASPIVKDIVDTALCLSRISFALFVLSVIAHWAKIFFVRSPDSSAELIKQLREEEPKPGLKELVELLKELSKLANALVKGGPAIWSLTGSIFFLMAAAIVGGVLPNT